MKKDTWMELKGKYLMKIFMLAMTVAVSAVVFFLSPITSHAESQGRVTVPSVIIRQEATTDSTMIGGATSGETLTVISQTQGTDNFTWYKVQKGELTGYVRGDCISITDGSVPPTEGEQSAETPVDVTVVNPVSATVTNDGGRIRANGSTTSDILADVPNGAVLTVTGQATGTDGALWYKVSYDADGSQTEGFIRWDYVTLSEELTPWTEPPAEQPQEPEEPVPAQPDRPYEIGISQDSGEWCLYEVGDEEKAFEIKMLFEIVEKINKGEYVAAESYSAAEKRQKVVIIILVFLLAAAVAGIAFLVFKIRDMMDSAYFSEVENETLRKRSAAAGNKGSKVMHTVGADKQQGKPSGARPSGASQRPAGAGQGQRPAGSSQGQRPMRAVQGQKQLGTSQRPVSPSQGQRQPGASQRPVSPSQSQRPSGSSQGQRPSGASQRPSGTPQGARPGQSAQGNIQKPQSKSGQRQSRNFMAEDDEEFEFEFLNYNGDDGQ